jgi:hypothetical protein
MSPLLRWSVERQVASQIQAAVGDELVMAGRKWKMRTLGIQKVRYVGDADIWVIYLLTMSPNARFYDNVRLEKGTDGTYRAEHQIASGFHGPVVHLRVR